MIASPNALPLHHRATLWKISLLEIGLIVDCLCTAGCDVLRALYPELTTMLDARTVAANMYQRKALTLNELQPIQSRTDRPIKAAETLLNFIMEQPDTVYRCFLDVLQHTDQLHVYRRVVENTYQGR